MGLDKVMTNKLGMRRSCDHCGRRKKKCDGSLPCGRCQGAGKKCIYSKRRWHQPPPQQQSPRDQQQRDSAGMHGAEESQPSTSGVRLAFGMRSLKRCRLSASPATGLVGMQENAYLSDFFGCVGFLPLTTQSHIRETMVSIMACPAMRQPTGVWDDCDEAETFGAISTEGNLSTAALEGKQLPMDPSTCIFWCAVALGALVKGYPIESVANYTRLATAALGTSSGAPNTEVAKALAILSYLHGFMGNKIKFQEYQDLSNSFVDASIEEGSSGALPLGYLEMMEHERTVKVCAGDAQPAEIKAFYSRQQDPPQISAAADERELYIYVTQSFKAFEQGVFAKACEMSATARGRSEDAQPREEGSGDAPLLSEVADAMAAGLQENALEFERLEESVDRPAIRNGVGGLVINGTLVFKKASKGDVDGTLERIARCVEVYERYPGLCRCMMRWFHVAHVMLAALAALVDPRAVELYGRLRAAYNPFRPPGSLPVPPLEEWQGVSSYCEDFHCRSIEGVIGSGALSVFSTQLVKERKDGEVDASLALDGQNNAGVLVGGVVLEEMWGRPIPLSPCSSGGELETASSACSTAQANQPACHPHIELEMGLNVGVACSWDGLGSSVGAPHLEFKDETGDGGITEANWLDVTHAMLCAIDS